jgi:hypothetical protein
MSEIMRPDETTDHEKALSCAAFCRKCGCAADDGPMLAGFFERFGAALLAAEHAWVSRIPIEQRRDLAVSIVDELYGYGVSFASDPARHRRDYDFVEAKLKNALPASADKDTE